MNPESVVPYLVIAVVGILVWSRVTGRPLSLSFRRPTVWDIVPIAFAVYMPVVGAVIPSGFVASVVVVLTVVALWLVWRGLGQPGAEAAPPAR